MPPTSNEEFNNQIIDALKSHADMYNIQMGISALVNENPSFKMDINPLIQIVLLKIGSPDKLILMRFLIDHGADIHVRDLKGNALIVLISKYGWGTAADLNVLFNAMDYAHSKQTETDPEMSLHIEDLERAIKVALGPPAQRKERQIKIRDYLFRAYPKEIRDRVYHKTSILDRIKSGRLARIFSKKPHSPHS